MKKVHKAMFNWGAAIECWANTSNNRHASSPHWANVTCKNCLKKKEK